MAQTSITLTASMRSNLSSLKSIQSQMDKTQERLSTGKKVNSAIDNASAYYQARSLTNRAADLDSLLDSMGQGIQTIQAANEGIEAITTYVEQLKSVATSAFALDSTSSTYKTELKDYQDQYNAILKEIGTLAKDSSYQGVNLLKGNDLTVMFNESRTHKLVVEGQNVTEEMQNAGAAAFQWANASSPSDAGNGTIDWMSKLDELVTVQTGTTITGERYVGTTEGITVGAALPTGVELYTREADGSYATASGNAVAGTTYYIKETLDDFEAEGVQELGGSYTDANGKVWTITEATAITEQQKSGTAASAIDLALTDITKVNTYLRTFATELGNNFSIIETRQDFTEALVDVLETGSDNLVLADMNEESANYLALQTRQQLAINSLSLASQSAQSVLKLF